MKQRGEVEGDMGGPRGRDRTQPDTSVYLMNVIEPVDQFKVVAGWNGINLRFPIEVLLIYPPGKSIFFDLPTV